jgi:hypothetical protein
VFCDDVYVGKESERGERKEKQGTTEGSKAWRSRQQLENPGEAMKTFVRLLLLLDLEAARVRDGEMGQGELGPGALRVLGCYWLIGNVVPEWFVGCCLFVLSCCCCCVLIINKIV